MADEPKVEPKKDEPKTEEKPVVKPSPPSSSGETPKAQEPVKEQPGSEPSKTPEKKEGGSNGHKLVEDLTARLRDEADRRAKLEERLAKLENPSPGQRRLLKPMLKSWGRPKKPS